MESNSNLNPSTSTNTFHPVSFPALAGEPPRSHLLSAYVRPPPTARSPPLSAMRAVRCAVLTPALHTTRPHPVARASRPRSGPIVLCPCYAMSGTDLSYHATRV
eukprot:2647512-Rhodomonas_salina.1